MNEKNKKDVSKGEFQHQMFKLVILVIAFIFCCLIGGFIYITLTSSSQKNLITIIEDQFSTEESILKSNEQYYKKISNLDNYNFNFLLNNTSSRICSYDNFYKTQVYYHVPCIANINITNIINKYFEFISREIYNKENSNENFFKKPKSDNIGRLCINNSDKKINVLISPISQIKFFNIEQKKNNEDFVNIYLKNNIDDRKDVIYYDFHLNKFDSLYIPSYYFIQIKEEVNDMICYEYQDISSFNDMVFKILYN